MSDRPTSPPPVAREDPEASRRALRAVMLRVQLGHESLEDAHTILQALGLVPSVPGAGVGRLGERRPLTVAELRRRSGGGPS